MWIEPLTAKRIDRDSGLMSLSKNMVSFTSTLWRHGKLLLILLTLIVASAFAVLGLRPSPEGIPVYVAAKDLQAGSLLEPGSTTVVLVPQSAVSDNVVTPPAPLEGLAITRDASARTLITTDLVLPEDAELPSGYSRITLSVPGAAAKVTVGEMVDVWGLSHLCELESCRPTVLSRDVRILDLNQESSGVLSGIDNLTQITLLMRSADVAAVLHTNATGTLHFVLSTR